MIYKCTDCGKPLQYCECKFGVINFNDVTWQYVENLKTPLEDYLEDTDWSNVKITTSVYNPHANIAPVTLFEYFQQIGDE